ncbi:MAG: hypothetical protein GY716_22520 [bacterium]|nr:hypothetical protein [bacterium]
MSPHDRRDEPDLLLEAAASPFRESDAHGRLQPSPDWADLSADERDRLFARQLEARRIERALAPDGLSATAKAVLERVQRLGQL